MKSVIRTALWLAGCATIALAAPAAAKEGMWMPNQAAEIGEAMRADGLRLDPAQLGRLDAAPLNGAHRPLEEMEVRTAPGS